MAHAVNNPIGNPILTSGQATAMLHKGVRHVVGRLGGGERKKAMAQLAVDFVAPRALGYLQRKVKQAAGFKRGGVVRHKKHRRRTRK